MINIESKRRGLGENRLARSQLYNVTLACDMDSKRSHEKGSARIIIIAEFFDSMLESIVRNGIISDVTENKDDESNSETNSDRFIASSATTSTNIKTIVVDSRHTRSLSMSSIKGAIYFVNDNVYEGDIFKNRMHGDGCFRWTDGTTYRGQFKDNRINGTGIIEFKDNTWYEGEFVNNLRHGKGLYVNSGEQRSYYGHWSGGAKTGHGVMYYTQTFQNSYDGEWRDNLRHGCGLRRYCSKSEFDGNWNNNVREGNGLMIWPNSDVYDGEWKNNLMCGYGKYIWSSFNNDSMSLPALSAYRGSWDRGLRDGQGAVDFGFGTGSCYNGQFKNNRKNGAGHLLTNNGQILQNILFVDDNLSTLNKTYDAANEVTSVKENKLVLDMYNELELEYHIRETFQTDIAFRDNKIINKYLEANYDTSKENIDKIINNVLVTDLDSLMEFEISSLRKSLMYYNSHLKRIYNVYATVCNKKDVIFEPVLIRLYLWQMYYDCRIHDKALTMYEIDELLTRNTKWQVKQPHDPFEEIYFWQFLHSLISVATHVYANKCIKNRKPHTVLASSFRRFIEEDVLPHVGEKRGKLVNGYGRVIPLQSLYNFFLSLDNPCTIRSIICKVYKGDLRTGKNSMGSGKIFTGKNTYSYNDAMSFLFDSMHPYVLDLDIRQKTSDLSIFMNVPPKVIIKIFSKIFPQITEVRNVIILDNKLTFFEFFEAFVELAEESVKLEEIEMFKL